jgi:Ni,Fe-hydrogenase III large subunit
MAERERVANHLGDFAAICNDVGFSFAYYQFMRLKELWVRMSDQAFGHRFMFDRITVGGVIADLDTDQREAMQRQISELKKELGELYPMIENNSSLHDRLKKTGKLSREDAKRFGTLGYVGRASGCSLDLRRDVAYSPYDKLNVHVPVYDNGDVLARTRIRAQEILVSLGLLEDLLAELPKGAFRIDPSAQMLQKAGEGVGLVEGWRGEILVYVRINENGLVERFFPRDPSWFNWLALEQLIHGNIVPDFPACNKSINGSYSGVDL